jgi:DnaJ-class molecular chaperone
MFEKVAFLNNRFVMSSNPQVCKECKGTGFVTVKNAYDPDYEERDFCPYCFGVGNIGNAEDLK